MRSRGPIIDIAATKQSKAPRTERGRKTLRKLLDAAAIEFGERGFHEASVSSITRRAGVALGSFYTYFDSKDELFRALVRDMSEQVKINAGQAVEARLASQPASGAFDIEQAALQGFLDFAREHKEIYRIIDESEFVDPQTYRQHYENTVVRITDRLRKAAETGEVREDVEETHAWAVMGMYVFLGLRYSVWDDQDASHKVSQLARSILERGLSAQR